MDLCLVELIDRLSVICFRMRNPQIVEYWKESSLLPLRTICRALCPRNPSMRTFKLSCQTSGKSQIINLWSYN